MPNRKQQEERKESERRAPGQREENKTQRQPKANANKHPRA